MYSDHEFLANILLRLNNLIRTGIIIEVKQGKVKVQSGSLVTRLVPYLTARAGDCTTWWQPSINEQVLLFCPSGEINNAIVLPAIYNSSNQPPEDFSNEHKIIYKDGTTVSYNYENKILNIETSGEVKIKASKLTIEAETNVIGKLNATDIIKSDIDVVANNKSGKNHTHTDAEGRTTSTPQ